MAKVECIGHFEGQTQINNESYFIIEADDDNGSYKGKPLQFLVNSEEYPALQGFKRCDTLSLEGDIVSQSHKGLFLDNIEWRDFDNE